MNNNWKVVSKDTPRLESAAKVTGKGAYTADRPPQGTAYGMILRSPHPHARVTAIDAAQARAMDGVLAVLLPEDVADIRFNSSGNPPSDLLLSDERILTDHPLFEGDRVAAVAAESPALCRQALERIAVTYEVLPPLIGVEKAIAPTAPPLHPELSGSNLFRTIAYDLGDVEEGLAGCDIVLEDEFFTPAVHPLPLEPTGCTCEWNTEGITVHGTSQTPFQERRLLADMFGLPQSMVRVVKPLMGGGFGARQQLHHQPVGCLLSRRTGRPVTMIYTREEEMLATMVRHAAKMHVRLGANRDGEILAMDAEVWHDTGAYCTHGPIILAAQGKKTPYRLRHYRYRGHCVYTNSVTAGAMRGYGNPQLTFAREMLIDRLARELDMDPLQLRLRNCLQTGDLVPGTQTLVTSSAIEACAREAQRLREGIDRQDSRPAQWATVFCMHTSGPSNKTGMSSASLYVNPDGSVQLNIGSSDIGQGCETALAQVAAEVLGIPLAKIRVHAADTRSTPYDTGTFASSQMFVGGNAVLQAAHNTLERIARALADKAGCSPDAVRFEDGVFHVGETAYPFAEAIRAIMFGTPGQVILGEGCYRAQEAPPVFAVCMLRALRDELTGEIRVTDIVETVDVGTVINRNIVRGQIEGGVLQGLGYGWMEQVELDRRTNKNFCSDALLYKIPTSMDLPRIHAAAVQSYDPHGPLGAKSIGELTLVPVAAALAACVERLCGKEVRRLPMSLQEHLGADVCGAPGRDREEDCHAAAGI